MIALVVFLALLFWAGVFTVFFTLQGTTALEFLFGRYEVPPELGKWHPVPEAGADGAGGAVSLLREERFLLPGERADARYLLHQVRYRDAVTRVIVSVEPERRVRRRRVNARST